ncbi:hypothetical protein Tco_0377851 [Tanacetum coccineum]
MTTLKYSDKHNMVAFLKKPNESVGFTEIVDFLKGTSLRYVLTHNPTIYDSLVKQFWLTATVKTLANGTPELVASIDNNEYTIAEASVRSILQLADAAGISNLPDAEIYDGLATLGGYAGDYVPLLPAMLEGAAEDQADEVTTTGVRVGTEGATTTTFGLDAGLDSSNIHESPFRSHEALFHEGHTSGSAEDSLQLKELMVFVPKLVTGIANLKKELHQTKTTYGKAILTLVERGRKNQDIDDDPLVSLVRESMKDKDTDFVTPTKISASGEVQEQDINPTTLEAAKTLSHVISQKKTSTDKGIRYKRKTRSKSIEKDISTDLDADIEVNSGSEDFNTGNEDFNTGSLGVSTVSGPVSTPSVVQTINVTIPSPIKSQREGKAPMTTEEIQATKRTKAQIQQEEAGLAEAMRLQALQEEEAARQVHLDALLAKRISEEEELSEQQKKRKAEVQEAAQYYTEEDWDTIRAKLEANAELTKSLQGESMTSEDFAKRMVEMINQKKKFYAEQKAKARRSKPMTQAQQRDYMSTFIKNQSSWKLTQLKKLTFDELKTEFEKLVKSIENFVPMETDERVKRQGVQLEQEFSKKQKTIEEVSVLEESITEPVIAKEEEIEKSVKKRGKIRKQKARKGIHIDKTAQDESEEEREAFMKDKVTSASSESEIGIDAIPTATKPPSIVDWKIIPQSGLKAVYQIIRRDGSDKIYMSFGAILKDFSRDDLTELYRLVIKKYGANRSEEMYDRVLWGDLKTMFDPPLNDDTIWSLPTSTGKMIKHQELASPKQPICCTKALATPEQTATGKEISNLLTADSLLKTIREDKMLLKIKSQNSSASTLVSTGRRVSITPHCVLSKTIHCVLSKILHCVLSKILYCVLSKTLHCVLSKTLHCVLSKILYCVLSKTLHCVLSKTLHCVLSKTLHCVLSKTLHCVLSKTLHCVLSKTLHCVLSKTLYCVLSKILHCVLSKTLHCVLSKFLYCVLSKTLYCVLSKILHCILSKTLHCVLPV